MVGVEAMGSWEGTKVTNSAGNLVQQVQEQTQNLAQQIQEQTLTFIPKIVAMVAAAIVLMPWIGARLLEYSATMFMGQ